MAKTKVQPHRQKLMGIKYNTQLPDSEITIASLKLRRNQKILVRQLYGDKANEVR